MYNQDPYWLIPSVYLASDRLFYFHLQRHIDPSLPPDFQQEKERRAVQLAAKDYQYYFGGRLRKEDIANNAQDWALPSDKRDCCSLLEMLGEEFLIWQGDCFEVRAERLDAWMMLCSVIDPAWIIAQSYVRLIQQNVLSEQELPVLLTGRQCPFAFPAERGNFTYADNHVHFNGHGYTSLSMLSFIDGEYRLNPKVNWPHREEYSLFESELLSKNQLPRWLSGYLGCLLSVIYPHAYGSAKDVDYTALAQTMALPIPVQDRYRLQDLTRTYAADTVQQRILYASAQPQHKGYQRWLLFCCGLMLGEHQADYRSTLSNFIRASNILRNYMVVSAVGLGQFVEFFNTKVRRLDNHYSKQEVVRYDLDSNVSREYRVSPNEIIGNNKKLNIYHHKLIDFIESHDRWHVPEQAHLVVHFTRGIPKECSRNDKRLKGLRDTLWLQVRAFESFASSVTLQKTTFQPQADKPAKIIDVRRLVRGFDVAGNENELPIEIFAPALRVLRAAKHPAGMPLSTRLPRPFITVHAGEDYSHLLSGLRAMDEAVEFCQLREGDRLGHGLALGVDVRHWALRQRRAYLTAGQHLDNLVWAYHQAVQLSQHTAEHIPVMHELRDKIHHWSQRLFNDVFTPNLLYRAWLLRRNWPNYEDVQSNMANSKEWSPDIEFLMQDGKQDEGKAKKLWQHYLNSGLPENADAWENRIISINCQPEKNESLSSVSGEEDVISPGELRLYEAIQDFLMEKYNRLGLVIEACPTSNIYIGRFEKYHEHPLFRWNPPQQDWLKPGEKFNRYGLRSGPLAVCINTDDSALMPTTIANEHRIMRETAIHNFGISTWMADLWITSIRQKGAALFQSNHLFQDSDLSC